MARASATMKNMRIMLEKVFDRKIKIYRISFLKTPELVAHLAVSDARGPQTLDRSLHVGVVIEEAGGPCDEHKVAVFFSLSLFPSIFL